MPEFQQLYNAFLNYFPAIWRPFVSLGLAGLLIYSVFQIIKRNFIFLLLLIILLPASVPILKSIWQGVLQFLTFILNTI